MGMKTLAIDQSYTSAGIVILVDGDMTHCERYVTNKEHDAFDRAWELTQHIRALASAEKPDVIAIEGLAFASSGNATRDLAGLQFTIVNVLRQVDGYEVKIYSPQNVKKVATGKGNSKKEELLACLPKNALTEFESLGVKKTTGLLDLTDAYFIGITAELEAKK